MQQQKHEQSVERLLCTSIIHVTYILLFRIPVLLEFVQAHTA